MNSANRQTLDTIFRRPVPLNLDFSKIEALLLAIGCKAIEGDGSRVRFVKGKAVITFHRPHPDKKAKPYQIRDVRAFLEQIGTTPAKKETI